MKGVKPGGPDLFCTTFTFGLYAQCHLPVGLKQITDMRKLALLIIIACLFSGCSERKGKLLEFPNTRQAYDFSCGPGAVQVVMAY